MPFPDVPLEEIQSPQVARVAFGTVGGVDVQFEPDLFAAILRAKQNNGGTSVSIAQLRIAMTEVKLEESNDRTVRPAHTRVSINGPGQTKVQEL